MRRFQQGGPASRCRFGCPGSDNDAIEHYAGCPHVAEFGRRVLNIPAGDLMQRRLDFFLLSSGLPEQPDRLVRLALRTAATYRAHNAIRTSTGASPEVAYAALAQAARELARGHARTTAVFDAAFAA